MYTQIRCGPHYGDWDPEKEALTFGSSKPGPKTVLIPTLPP